MLDAIGKISSLLGGLVTLSAIGALVHTQRSWEASHNAEMERWEMLLDNRDDRDEISDIRADLRDLKDKFCKVAVETTGNINSLRAEIDRLCKPETATEE
jgi:hypothetical protein